MDVFGTYIYIHGVYKPTNITGAPRLMTTDEIIQLQVLGPTKIDEKLRHLRDELGTASMSWERLSAISLLWPLLHEGETGVQTTY